MLSLARPALTAPTPDDPTNQSPASAPQSTNNSPAEETDRSTEPQASGTRPDRSPHPAKAPANPCHIRAHPNPERFPQKSNLDIHRYQSVRDPCESRRTFTPPPEQICSAMGDSTDLANSLKNRLTTHTSPSIIIPDVNVIILFPWKTV